MEHRFSLIDLFSSNNNIIMLLYFIVREKKNIGCWQGFNMLMILQIGGSVTTKLCACYMTYQKSGMKLPLTLCLQTNVANVTAIDLLITQSYQRTQAKAGRVLSLYLNSAWVCRCHRPNNSLLSESFIFCRFRHHRPPTPTALFCQTLPTSSARVAVSTPTHEKYELWWMSQRRRDEGSSKERNGTQSSRDKGKVFNRLKQENKTRRKQYSQTGRGLY